MTHLLIYGALVIGFGFGYVVCASLATATVRPSKVAQPDPDLESWWARMEKARRR